MYSLVPLPSSSGLQINTIGCWWSLGQSSQSPTVSPWSSTQDLWKTSSMHTDQPTTLISWSTTSPMQLTVSSSTEFWCLLVAHSWTSLGLSPASANWSESASFITNPSLNNNSVGMTLTSRKKSVPKCMFKPKGLKIQWLKVSQACLLV